MFLRVLVTISWQCSKNDFTANMGQAINWTNGDLGLWRHIASLGHTVLIKYENVRNSMYVCMYQGSWVEFQLSYMYSIYLWYSYISTKADQSYSRTRSHPKKPRLVPVNYVFLIKLWRLMAGNIDLGQPLCFTTSNVMCQIEAPYWISFRSRVSLICMPNSSVIMSAHAHCTSCDPNTIQNGD